MKIPKWQHKFVRKYRGGKLFFNFINNPANTCSYDLKISRDIKIKYVFHSKAFFHILSTIFIQVTSAPLSVAYYQNKLYFVHLSSYLRLGLFISYLGDLFFHYPLSFSFSLPLII